jgi:hypothetical protein
VENDYQILSDSYGNKFQKQEQSNLWLPVMWCSSHQTFVEVQAPHPPTEVWQVSAVSAPAELVLDTLNFSKKCGACHGNLNNTPKHRHIEGWITGMVNRQHLLIVLWFTPFNTLLDTILYDITFYCSTLLYYIIWYYTIYILHYILYSIILYTILYYIILYYIILYYIFYIVLMYIVYRILYITLYIVMDIILSIIWYFST